MTTEPLHYAAFLLNSVSHTTHGLWRSPESQQVRFNDLAFWSDLAEEVEAAGFDLMFFADAAGLANDFGGGWAHHIEAGMGTPSNDPSMLVAALVARTKRIGFAFTAAPIQEPPFNFARRISTLDHLSGGRVSWNIVTNGFKNTYRNYGYEQVVEHDERYRWADEYADVLYKLWEGSWEDDAVLVDRENFRYADPDKVHKIHHHSERYDVEGPHQSQPSPQRTPVIFQAGSSPSGRDFAARHTEVQLIITPGPESARRLIADTRRLAVQHGREPHDIKFFQGLSFVIGRDEDDVKRKWAEFEHWLDLPTMAAHLGSAIGLDLGNVPLDTPLELVDTDGSQSIVEWVAESTPGRRPTVEDLARLHATQTCVAGTADQIADELERWRDAGVSGINVINHTIPGSYRTFISELLPTLRRRGLAREADDLPVETLRHRLFGQDRLNDRHPAARYRGAFRDAVVGSRT